MQHLNFVRNSAEINKHTNRFKHIFNFNSLFGCCQKNSIVNENKNSQTNYKSENKKLPVGLNLQGEVRKKGPMGQP